MKTKLILLFAMVFSLTTTAQKWTNYTKANGLPDNDVHSIAIDAQGNIWIGTGYYDGSVGGVTKFNGANFTTYTKTSGLANNLVNAIAIDSQDNIWFGTGYESKGRSYGGVSKFDGTTWTTYTTTNGLADNCVNCIAIDSQGNKWFGTGYKGNKGRSYGGISKFDGTTWTTYTTANGLADNYVKAIAIDAQGNKWFGTNKGVSKFDGTNWTTYTETDGLANNDVRSIAIDVQGNKWFGTWLGGVSKFDGTNWTTYTETDGLACKQVNSIFIDAQGNKWFGTGQVTMTIPEYVMETHGGVSKFDGTNWINYNTTNGLIDNYVNSIVIDAQGNKWFGTGKGVSKYSNGKPVELTKSHQTSLDILNPIQNEISECIRIGNELYFKAKFIECAHNYDSLLIKYPNNYIAYYNRGIAKFYANDAIGAASDLEHAYILGDNDAILFMAKHNIKSSNKTIEEKRITEIAILNKGK